MPNTIGYTLDGTDPLWQDGELVNGQPYLAPLPLTVTTTVKAATQDSPVTTETYIIGADQALPLDGVTLSSPSVGAVDSDSGTPVLPRISAEPMYTCALSFKVPQADRALFDSLLTSVPMGTLGFSSFPLGEDPAIFRCTQEPLYIENIADRQYQLTGKITFKRESGRIPVVGAPPKLPLAMLATAVTAVRKAGVRAMSGQAASTVVASPRGTRYQISADSSPAWQAAFMRWYETDLSFGTVRFLASFSDRVGAVCKIVVRPTFRLERMGATTTFTVAVADYFSYPVEVVPPLTFPAGSTVIVSGVFDEALYQVFMCAADGSPLPESGAVATRVSPTALEFVVPNARGTLRWAVAGASSMSAWYITEIV